MTEPTAEPPDDRADPTGLGIHRPMTTPVVPSTAPEPTAPVELTTPFSRPVAPDASREAPRRS